MSGLNNVGKTAVGTAGFALSGGAVGADEFAATSRFAAGTGNFLWNVAGNTFYTSSGGLLAQQEHAAFLGYLGAAGQGISGLWDSTAGAWGRGDYVSAGASLGGLVGIPIPGAAAVKIGGRIDGFVANSADDFVTVYRVDTNGFPARLVAGEGGVAEIPVITTRGGNERALFINVDQPARAKQFFIENRSGNATLTAVDVNRGYLEELRLGSITEQQAKQFGNAFSPLRVDKVYPDQFGLRTATDIQRFREAIKPGSARVVDPNDL